MSTSRRDFIKDMGCLTVGFSIVPIYFKNGDTALDVLIHTAPQAADKINSWIKVLANGQVQVYTGKLELGQGIKTAIAQVAAEELDLDMKQVEVILASTGVTPDEGYTAGSGSIEHSAMAIRNAAAAARLYLLELASERMKTPVSELNCAGGKVSVKNQENGLTFYEILDGKQMSTEIRLPITVKPKNSYRLVGKPVLRDDIKLMVRATHVYVQDLRFRGMVHARIVRPPSYTAKLQSFDEQALKTRFPELLKIVTKGSFIGIITTNEYTAVQAQAWLRDHTIWSSTADLPSGLPMVEYLKSRTVQHRNVSKKGNPEITGATADYLKSSYYKPYIMHGSIGPSCSVARYENERLQIWTHSQGVYPLRDAVQKLLKIPAESIQVTGVPGSGCYGHNGADDVAADVAMLAVAYPGKHIRLQWSREDEHAWEPYGSAMIMEIAAKLDATGKISHWNYNMWSDSHSIRPGGRPENLLAYLHSEKEPIVHAGGFSGGAYRNSESYYNIPNQQTDAHAFQGPLRVSALRSLGAYGNIFAIESFMDELAKKAGADPYQFRLKHLTDTRAVTVVNKLQSIMQAVQPVSGTGIGIAFSRYKNSAAYCAIAAAVKIDKATGMFRVVKMWAVIDAGEVINPDGLRNQTEGGMIQSASWTLKEQVLFDKKQVTSRNWDNYPIYRFNEVPEVEVTIIDHADEDALGAGEAAQGPAAAAIVNAIYHVSGKRIRELPVEASYQP